MKKIILSIMAALFLSLPVAAQSYTKSKYYNPNTGR